MQYTGSNLAAIISNFDINPEGVSVNFANQSVKLGTYTGKRLHLNEWVVIGVDKLMVIVSDAVAQSILLTRE